VLPVLRATGDGKPSIEHPSLGWFVRRKLPTGHRSDAGNTFSPNEIEVHLGWRFDARR
jgi:hypothetical protein